ncbi:ribosome modulation factor [Haliea atlantica]|jgi:ribosome modulation factor|nr:ribosome modulation factor [Haliea sp.]MAL96627.1 ribosome modulation factor [Haliea sp.]|tara:strand:+ start:128 stop:334 length:207 start_codon:yes stop_codon:yes gene_type:complete
MKKQKRDMGSRAFDRGYRAGLSGRSADLCPHGNEEQRQAWITGWREGRVDQWDGLTGVSGVHKMRVSS